MHIGGGGTKLVLGIIKEVGGGCRVVVGTIFDTIEAVALEAVTKGESMESGERDESIRDIEWRLVEGDFELSVSDVGNWYSSDRDFRLALP